MAPDRVLPSPGPTGPSPDSRNAAVGPGRWLAPARVVVRLWFRKSLFSNIGRTRAGGVLLVSSATERWTGFLPERLAEWAASHPVGWYRTFPPALALPNAPRSAQLTAFGEVTVGFGLTLGLLTGIASLGGIFLLLSYALASAGRNSTSRGFTW